MLSQIQGVLTALPTPFKSGELDLPALGRLVERQLAAGIHGLVPCGTTGETPTLRSDEWDAVVRATVEITRGRAPVIAGCGTNATSTTVAAIERAKSLGADAALVVLPYYNKPSPAGLTAHVAAAASVGLPLVLYHIPGRTAQRLAPEQLAQLCATPGVIAVKEATGELDYAQRFMELSRVACLGGDDFIWAALSCMGGSGVISVLSNVAPKACVDQWSAVQRSDLKTVRAIQQRLLPVSRWLFHQTNPIPVKAALAAMGLCGAELRLPLVACEAPPAGLLDGLE